jgi:hypothetical protein
MLVMISSILTSKLLYQEEQDFSYLKTLQLAYQVINPMIYFRVLTTLIQLYNFYSVR